MPSAEQLTSQAQKFADELAADEKADTELHISHYMEEHIHPALKTASNEKNSKEAIETYFSQTDPDNGQFHTNRRNYAKTLLLVNERMTTILDSRQEEIQAELPHYYERFKTDGVEHNLYIGASILQNRSFGLADLYKLRLWQLRVIAEIENAHHHLKEVVPYPVEVTSLILVLSAPICIRFRMDEKHFDVDGAYNVRYEIIKKRIDKAHIKNTKQRVTQPGKLTIIYTSEEEEQEYLNYIYTLQEKNIFTTDIE